MEDIICRERLEKRIDGGSCLPVAGMDVMLSGLWVYRIKLGGDEALFCCALRETHFLWGTLDCLSAMHEVDEGFTDPFGLPSRIVFKSNLHVFPPAIHDYISCLCISVICCGSVTRCPSDEVGPSAITG